MIGETVEIRSAGGIVYRGIVHAIRDAGDLGELFELGSADDRAYRRLVYVRDRQMQIQKLDRIG